MSSQFLSVLRTACRVTVSRFLPLYATFLITYGVIILLLWTLFKSGSPLSLLIISGFVLFLLSIISTLVVCHQLGSRLMHEAPTITTSFLLVLPRYLTYIVANLILILPYLMGLLLLLFAALLWMSSLFPLFKAAVSQISLFANFTASPDHSLTLILTGAIILLLWGIYLSVRAALCAPIAVMEKLSIRGIIHRTKVLIKGKWWWTATVLFVCPLLTWIMQSIANVIKVLITTHPMTDSRSAIMINGLIYILVIMPFAQLFFAGVITALWQNLTLRAAVPQSHM